MENVGERLKRREREMKEKRDLLGDHFLAILKRGRKKVLVA